MTGKEKVRILAGRLASAGTRTDKGDFGEIRAKQWFERHDVDFYHWPQSPEEMPSCLRLLGGKRPDFTITLGSEAVYVDAKYHLTNDLTEFALEDVELAKFSAFRAWAHQNLGDTGDRDVVFMVYPIELSGQRFVVIHLDELLDGEPTVVRGGPGRKVSLAGRDETWFDQWPENDGDGP